MSEPGTKRKVPIKTDCQYLIRAKLYGVIALNSLEGMMRELDALIPVDIEKGLNVRWILIARQRRCICRRITALPGRSAASHKSWRLLGSCNEQFI